MSPQRQGDHEPKHLRIWSYLEWGGYRHDQSKKPAIGWRRSRDNRRVIEGEPGDWLTRHHLEEAQRNLPSEPLEGRSTAPADALALSFSPSEL